MDFFNKPKLKTDADILQERQENEFQNVRLEQEFFKKGVLEKLDEYLEKQTTQKKPPVKKEEILTIPNGGLTFDDEGYLYSSLFVSDEDEGTILTTELHGVKKTYFLKAGYNKINFLAGAEIKTDKTASFIVIRSNELLEADEKNKTFAVEPFTGTEGQIIYFKQHVNGLVFSNDSAAEYKITIKNDTYTVKGNEVLNLNLLNFKEVKIEGTGNFRGYGLV